MDQSDAAIASSINPTRVLFARVGWMKNYAGPQPGDERPKGGGGHNKKNVGHELFNFAEFGAHLYGFARAKNGRVNLTRIDLTARAAGKLDDVLVIFVARQHIIGWYRNATVYATTRPKFPASVAKEMLRRLKQSGTKGFKLGGYSFEAAVENVTLLPTYERIREIPGNVKGGFGQSNICYFSRRDGKSKNSAWMNKAIQYVLSYDKTNLLTTPHAEVNSEEAATAAQEQAEGFQSDPRIRKTIEKHAMKEAQKALEKRGFSKFENTSATKPFDFTCWRKGKTFFIEVKGTQTAGKSVILTKNEVEHAKANPGYSILVIVHSVKMAGKDIAKAGIPEVTEKWDLMEGELTATQYLWKKAN
jgi:hypothetical protein